MYSVLAVDLDETLLADYRSVSPRTVAALGRVAGKRAADCHCDGASTALHADDPFFPARLRVDLL